MARINPGMMMLDGGGDYESLVAVAVQAAVASPAVVNTPANVAPKAAEVEKVVTAVIKAVAPDDSDDRLRQIARQATQAVVTNPAVIAAPAGKTVDTTTTQGIIAASAQPVPGIGGVVGGSSNAGAYASSGFPGSDKNPVPATTKSNVTTTFTPTGNTFTDTLNKLRAERGITPADVNASGQLDVKGLTDKRVDAAQAVAAKPVMSAEQKAGGGVVKWIGGVDGKYEIVMPIGSPLVGSKAAGWEPGRNNLAGQPTGTTTTTPTTTAVTTTPTTTAVTTTPTTTVTTVTPDRPIGTPPAFVYDPVSKTYKMPAKPAGEGNWTWDNLEGWVDTKVTPGSTGMEAGSDRTIAQDTFKNTLALYFGASEMSQPWANALFKVVSGYYKSGSTIDESLNLALQEARNNPVLEPFTKRFAGVFALQDRRAKGEALDVPTIAEFFKSQVTLGDRLREVGLGDIATNEILGEVLGTGKSVSAVLNLVNDVFMTIDNAPDALKKDLQVVAPGIDRTSIAKALLLGQRGADALQKQIKEVSVLSAAKSQGIGIENTLAADIAARGVDYGTALTNFGTVAKAAPDLQKLTEFSTGKAVKPTDAQGTLIKSLFQQDVKAQEQIRLEAEKEIARFGGSSGTLGSRSLASRNRANRVI